MVSIVNKYRINGTRNLVLLRMLRVQVLQLFFACFFLRVFVYFIWVVLIVNPLSLLILMTYDINCERAMNPQKLSKITVITLAIAALALTLTTLAVLTTSQNVPLTGTITAVNLGVYSDSACTQTTTALNVGTLNPGATTTQTVYIKNTGNVPETLTMTTNNWNPTNATSSLTLTWNRQNTVLNAGASIQATLTLTAASNTGSLTTFSCDVTLTGTQ